MRCIVRSTKQRVSLVKTTGEEKGALADLPHPCVQVVCMAAQEMEAAWQPPQEQRGDGRTALNDKFGY